MKVLFTTILIIYFGAQMQGLEGANQLCICENAIKYDGIGFIDPPSELPTTISYYDEDSVYVVYVIYDCYGSCTITGYLNLHMNDTVFTGQYIGNNKLHSENVVQFNDRDGLVESKIVYFKPIKSGIWNYHTSKKGQ